MKHLGYKLGTAAFFAISWIACASAADAPGGSYRRTCAVKGFDGNRLEAFCSPENGPNQRLSQIDVRSCGAEVFNRDGGLQCYARSGIRGDGRAIPRGSYVDTCRDIVVSRDQGRMGAQCKDRGGTYRATQMSFGGCSAGARIDNDDGRLVCRQ